MGKGKMCAQCGHVVSKIIRSLERNISAGYKEWLKLGEAKIVLKASEDELKLILAENPGCQAIHDCGLTQIASGSLTAIGFYPMHENDAPARVKALKLL